MTTSTSIPNNAQTTAIIQERERHADHLASLTDDMVLELMASSRQLPVAIDCPEFDVEDMDEGQLERMAQAHDDYRESLYEIHHAHRIGYEGDETDYARETIWATNSFNIEIAIIAGLASDVHAMWAEAYPRPEIDTSPVTDTYDDIPF